MSSQSEQSAQKQRINMTHGFMKSVIRNQIDRDNYDKEVKAKQQRKVLCRPTSRRPKKPELQTYVPPQRLQRVTDNGDVIFTLEYEHKDGEILKTEVQKCDCPKKVAKKVGYQFDLSETFIEALTHLIQLEMDTHVK